MGRCDSDRARIDEIRDWDVWRIKTDQGDNEPPGRGRLDASALLPPWKEADYVCFLAADGKPSEHDRLYYDVEYVRVWEQLAYARGRMA